MRFLLILICLSSVPAAVAGEALCDEARAPDDRSFVWCWESDDYTALIHTVRRSLYDGNDEVDLARREKFWNLSNRGCAKLTQGIEATFDELIWFNCYVRTVQSSLFISDRVGLLIRGERVWAREWWATEGAYECSLYPLLSTELPPSWIDPTRVWRSRRGSIKTWIAFPRQIEAAGGRMVEWSPEDVDQILIEAPGPDRASRTEAE